ncbi:MAG TPA: ABC transporter permease [Gemmataceae bacterium]|jgi:ABC-type polysaccharide/polyol phosphate export permease
MVAYLGAIWKCRFFWLSLVKVDLVSRYRGSVLGICWSLLHPIAMTAILCVVFRYAFNMPNVRTFAPLLFTGLTFWGFFSSVVVQGCGCFFQGEPYIRQFPAPMAIYPLRTVLASAFHFSIGLLLAIAIALLAGPAKEDNVAGPPRMLPTQQQANNSTEKAARTSVSCAIPNEPAKPPENASTSQTPEEEPSRTLQLMALPSLLPTLLLLLLFGWSVAILFGLLNVRFRDTRHLAEIGLQGLFYMTPIMYPKDMMKGRFLGQLLRCNPLTPILDLLREPILSGHIPSLTTYAVAGLIVLVLTVAAMVALKIEERRLIFHL